MATTTIHSLKYMITADTRQFTEGIVATKKELTAQKKVLRDIETPVEKYGQQLKSLDNLYHKGLITAEQYRRKLNQIEKEYKEAEKAARAAAKSTTDWVGAAKAGFTALAGSYVVTQFVDQIKGAVTEMDHLAKLAHRSGIDMEEFQRIALAMGYSTEASVEDVANMLNKMQRAIGEAVTGNKELGETFDRLNMSAGELATMSVDQQFLSIVDAISKIPTEAEQAAAATELFGRGSAVALDQIRNGIDDLANSLGRVDDLGVLIDNEDLQRMEEIADDMTDISLAWKSIWNDAAIIAAPLISDIRDAVTAWRDVLRDQMPGSSVEDEQRFRAMKLKQNAAVVDEYLAFKRTIPGQENATRLSDYERQRLFGSQGLDTARPVDAREEMQKMIRELEAIRGNMEQLVSSQESSPRSQR